MLLEELAPLVSAQQSIMYVVANEAGGHYLRQLASYADAQDATEPRRFRLRRGHRRPVRR